MGDEDGNVDPPEKRHELMGRLDAEPDGFVYLVGLFDQVVDTPSGPCWRLYLSPRRDCYAEFKADDVRDQQTVEDAVIPGFDAIRVLLRRGADVTFVWSEKLTTDDQFDLDVRMDAGRSGPKMFVVDRTMGSASCRRTC